MEGIKKAMNERNLNEGQWEDRKQWSLGVGQRRKTFWTRYIHTFLYPLSFIFCVSFNPRLTFYLLSKNFYHYAFFLSYIQKYISYVFHFFLTYCAFFSGSFRLFPIRPYILLTFVTLSHRNGSILPNFLAFISLSLWFPISPSMSAALSNCNDKP